MRHRLKAYPALFILKKKTPVSTLRAELLTSLSEMQAIIDGSMFGWRLNLYNLILNAPIKDIAWFNQTYPIESIIGHFLKNNNHDLLRHWLSKREDGELDDIVAFLPRPQGICVLLPEGIDFANKRYSM